MTAPPLFVLVDPDSQGLETLTHAFELAGCAVVATPSPLAAPEIIRSRRARLAVVSVRAPERAALDFISGLHIHPETKNLPVVGLGPVAFRAAALGAGAFDYLNMPLFVRDVLTISRLVLLMREALAAAAEKTAPLQISAPLADYRGLFYLVRAMAGTGRSGILEMVRDQRKGEIRFSEGVVTTAQTGALQGFPALHQLLLWTEGTISLRLRDVPARGQFSLSAPDILDECERFLRDYAHAAAEVGPATTVFAQDNVRMAPASRVVPSEIGPVARLFDGRRTLATVIEESPFRIFDTLRIVKQLLDAKALVARSPDAAAAATRPRTRTAAQGSRTTPPTLDAVPERRAGMGDRRKNTRSQRIVPLGGAAKGAAAVPIPLVVKKTPGLGTVAGEIGASVRRAPAPPVSGHEPTVQLKLDRPKLSLDMPVPQSAPPPAAMSTRTKTPAPRPAGVPQTSVRPARTKKHGTMATPTPVFDAVETEFFAREADLYKKEAVESFDDLDPRGDGRVQRRPTAAFGNRHRVPEKK